MKQNKKSYICIIGIICILLVGFPFTVKAKDYLINVLNSAGDPQVGIILRINGQEYISNEQGIIEFPYQGEDSPWVYLYFPNDKEHAIKSFPLEEANGNPVFHIDSPQDIILYKQKGTTFPIEGIVKDENERPIEGVGVSVQGTGRKTTTDEAGLFQIEGDYAHPIIFRAIGMENRSLHIERFLENPEDAYTVYMTPKNSSTIYSSAEQMPEFPGGMKAFKAYVDNHLQYPSQAKAAKKEGVVVVQFIVEKSGAITNAVVARKLESSMDEAALALVESMPDWIPAKDNGKTIRCKYSVPISFKLPKPQPMLSATPLVPLQTLKADSLKQVPDSLIHLKKDSLLNPLQKDSMKIVPTMMDSLKLSAIPDNDSLLQHRDSIMNDSIRKDTILNDSTQFVQPIQESQKKGNLFIRIARFFRHLFGIK